MASKVTEREIERLTDSSSKRLTTNETKRFSLCCAVFCSDVLNPAKDTRQSSTHIKKQPTLIHYKIIIFNIYLMAAQYFIIVIVIAFDY